MLSRTIYGAVEPRFTVFCRYEDDSCLRCEIVFDYGNRCFIRGGGGWVSDELLLLPWKYGSVVPFYLCRWVTENEKYMLTYITTLHCKIVSYESAWKSGGVCLEMDVLHIYTGMGVRIRMLLDAAFVKTFFYHCACFHEL